MRRTARVPNPGDRMGYIGSTGRTLERIRSECREEAGRIERVCGDFACIGVAGTLRATSPVPKTLPPERMECTDIGAAARWQEGKKPAASLLMFYRRCRQSGEAGIYLFNDACYALGSFRNGSTRS